MITEAALLLSTLTMILLWVATFVFARRRRAASKVIAFYVGTFVVWPAIAVSLGLLMAEEAMKGIEKPVGPGVAYLFGFAFVVTLLLWLAGYAAASITAWFVERRVRI